MELNDSIDDPMIMLNCGELCGRLAWFCILAGCFGYQARGSMVFGMMFQSRCASMAVDVSYIIGGLFAPLNQEKVERSKVPSVMNVYLHPPSTRGRSYRDVNTGPCLAGLPIKVHRQPRQRSSTRCPPMPMPQSFRPSTVRDAASSRHSLAPNSEQSSGVDCNRP